MNLKSEKGSALVWAAVTMSLFVMMGALVLDFGTAWALSAQVQAAADAAALAGVSTAVERLEVDRYGNIYGRQVTLDPFLCESKALETFNRNVQEMNFAALGVEVLSRSVSIDGLRVTFSARVRAPVVLLPSSGGPGTVEIGRRATAEWFTRD